MTSGAIRQFVSRYVGAGAPDEVAIGERLWQLPPDVLSSGDRTVLLEQYNRYLSLADRHGARRGLTSAFFVVLNTVVMIAVSALLLHRPEGAVRLVVPLAALLGQCLAWFCLIRSQRQLAAARYAVVARLEERLPAAPGAAEWAGVGLGRDPARYLPVSQVESVLPGLFALCYVAAFLLLV